MSWHRTASSRFSQQDAFSGCRISCSGWTPRWGLVVVEVTVTSFPTSPAKAPAQKHCTTSSVCCLASLFLHFSVFYPLLLFLSLIKSQRDIQQAAPRWCQHLVVSTLRARWKDDDLVLVQCSCLSHSYTHGANGQGHSLRIGECRKWVSFAKKSSWVLTELPGQCRHSL